MADDGTHVALSFPYGVFNDYPSAAGLMDVLMGLLASRDRGWTYVSSLAVAELFARRATHDHMCLRSKPGKRVKPTDQLSPVEIANIVDTATKNLILLVEHLMSYPAATKVARDFPVSVLCVRFSNKNMRVHNLTQTCYLSSYEQATGFFDEARDYITDENGNYVAHCTSYYFRQNQPLGQCIVHRSLKSPAPLNANGDPVLLKTLNMARVAKDDSALLPVVYACVRSIIAYCHLRPNQMYRISDVFKGLQAAKPDCDTAVAAFDYLVDTFFDYSGLVVPVRPPIADGIYVTDDHEYLFVSQRELYGVYPELRQCGSPLYGDPMNCRATVTSVRTFLDYFQLVPKPNVDPYIASYMMAILHDQESVHRVLQAAVTPIMPDVPMAVVDTASHLEVTQTIAAHYLTSMAAARRDRKTSSQGTPRKRKSRCSDDSENRSNKKTKSL